MTLNSESGSISNVTPALPSAEGKFKATLKLHGTSAPTMDLYFTGNIIKDNISRYPKLDYDVENPSSVSFNKAYFNISNEKFPTSDDIGVIWGSDGDTVSFYPSTFSTESSTYKYTYEGDTITLTNNWNDDTIVGIERSPSSYRYFSPPDLDNLSEAPTVYCNWEVRWGYECTCHTDCDGYCPVDGSSGGYITWDGTYDPNYVIRTSPGGDPAQFYLINYNVTVTNENGGWYYCAFNTTQGIQYGWVISDGISGKNPNHEDECPNKECTHEECTHEDCGQQGYAPHCPNQCPTADPIDCPINIFCPNFE